MSETGIPHSADGHRTGNRGPLPAPAHSRGELLSHVIFEPDLIDAAVGLGRRDARRIISNARDGGLLHVMASAV